MKNKKQMSTGRVILRILKDSLGISHWLLLATILSIGSALLAMKAPEILGRITNYVYDLLGCKAEVYSLNLGKECLMLAAAYLLSALLSALTSATMNYSVSLQNQSKDERKNLKNSNQDG